MNEPIPKVSVGLPVYNGENFLSEAIDSVLAQSFRDFELIISDNGSTDRTEAICRAYAVADSRIRYHRSDENHGAAWNFNRVLALARGKYFKWIAHDDRIGVDFLTRNVAVLDADPSVVLSYSRVSVIGETGEFIHNIDIELGTDDPRPWFRFRELLMKWHLCFEIFGVIRREALNSIGPMGGYSHGDGVMLGRLSLLGRFYAIPEYLIEARRHSRQSMNTYGVYENGETNYHEYAAWFDTSKSGRLIFPTWRMLWESARSPWLVKLSTRDRLLSLLYVGRWALRKRFDMMRDLRFGGRHLYRRVGWRCQSARNRLLQKL